MKTFTAALFVYCSTTSTTTGVVVRGAVSSPFLLLPPPCGVAWSVGAVGGVVLPPPPPVLWRGVGERVVVECPVGRVCRVCSSRFSTSLPPVWSVVVGFLASPSLLLLVGSVGLVVWCSCRVTTNVIDGAPSPLIAAW